MNSVDRWESVRQTAGIAPDKWAVMSSDERRAVERTLRRPPQNRMVERPGRDR